MISALKDLPDVIRETLKVENQVKQLAEKWISIKNLLVMGRGLGYGICKEGALKISYFAGIHVEGSK